MNITVGISTKNRYHLLSHCLLSIAMQTYKPLEVIVCDDSDKPMDLRTIPIYRYILQLFDDKGIEWKVEYGQRRGQHVNHQHIQEIAKGDWIFRMDDDCVAESRCLRELSDYAIRNNAGAVAPLVLVPTSELTTEIKWNDILKLDNPNVQWFRNYRPFDDDGWQYYQDHLYSCFLYKKGIADYELNLSPVAHREETIFSYKIKRAGHVLLVKEEAIVHHFRSDTGGIRSHNDQSYYDHDEGVFKSLLSLWNVNPDAPKVIVLDSGIGDHFAFKHVLPELKKRHKKIQIACCFNDVFFDEPELELISIAEAINMFHGCIDEFNIYRKMIDWNWSGTLVEAFEKLYLQ